MIHRAHSDALDEIWTLLRLIFASVCAHEITCLVVAIEPFNQRLSITFGLDVIRKLESVIEIARTEKSSAARTFAMWSATQLITAMIRAMVECGLRAE